MCKVYTGVGAKENSYTMAVHMYMRLSTRLSSWIISTYRRTNHAITIKYQIGWGLTRIFINHMMGTPLTDTTETYPVVIKLYSCSTQLTMKFQLLITTKLLNIKDFSCFQTLIGCIYAQLS